MDRSALLRVRRCLAALTCTLITLALASAQAQASTAAAPTMDDVAVPMFPVQVNDYRFPGFRVSPAQAVTVAEHSARMQSIHRVQHPLQYRVMVEVGSHYEVDFYYHGKLRADVTIDANGRLGPIYEGPGAMAVYARGHYAPVFDSPWTWAPFGAMFLLPLLLLRRRTWLERLDLAVVLSFGLSYFLFDTQHLEPAVWLAYPPLLYLLGRMLVRGLRGRGPSAPVDVALPTWVLAAGLVALVAGRIVVTLLPHLILDVGYASLIGAYDILHGHPLYFPSLAHPDTYGPINYLAYVPFEAIWPSKSWYTYLPAARAATITFDLLTISGLILLGRRLREGRQGLRLGLLLGWLWAACPFTVLGMVKNTNDGLVSLFAVLLLLAWRSPVRRGAVLGLAAAAKFVPAVLLPLIALRRRPGEESVARRVLFGFFVAAGLSVAIFLPPGGIQEMWDHTVGFQLTRPDIFSPWALHPALAPVKDAVELAVVALAVVVAIRPRGPRTTGQLAALAAALTIAVQLPALHWFYLYIVWFWPFVLVAVLTGGPQEDLTAPVVAAQAPAGQEAEREPVETLLSTA